ncbi:MAG: hypothetical protein QNJ97_10945 [Myxococcota bacterium]|nr:hypothetical protein [Myxococcota bacterium]
MKLILLIAMSVAFMFSACAGFQSDYKGKTPKEVEDDYRAANEGEKDGDQVVCKYEKPIGSNISRKICESKADRKRRQMEDQRNLDHMQRHSGYTTGGG